VFHPISRQLEGIIDISCLYKDTNDLILPLVVDAVRHSRSASFSTPAERNKPCSATTSGRPATPRRHGLSDKTIITNPLAAGCSRTSTRRRFWERAAQAVADRQSVSTTSL